LKGPLIAVWIRVFRGGGKTGLLGGGAGRVRMSHDSIALSLMLGKGSIELEQGSMTALGRYPRRSSSFLCAFSADGAAAPSAPDAPA
jgi:hypothetical protein